MYNYNEEKKKIFTDKGQRMFLKVRDHVHKILKMSGAITMAKAMEGACGGDPVDTWETMACVDRMVELKELQEIKQNDPAGQDRIFIKLGGL